MQAAEEAQSSLAERVESMGVSEQDKTAGKEEEKEKERDEETTETAKDTKPEDDTSMLFTFVSQGVSNWGIQGKSLQKSSVIKN